MSAVATKISVNKLQNAFLVIGSIALSGKYGGSATHGDTLDLSKMAPTNSVPSSVEIFEESASGSVPTKYRYAYGKGTKISNGVLNILAIDGDGAVAEYTQNADYSSNFPNTLKFVAVIPAA